MNDRQPFPGRDLAIFLAAGVIVLSLVLATLGLPRALRGLELPPDRPPLAEEERAREAGAQAALRAVESVQDALPANVADADLRAQASERVAALYRQRIDRHAGHDEASVSRSKADNIERELRLVALRAERNEVVRIGREHGIPEITLRKLVREIDLQEARYSA